MSDLADDTRARHRRSNGERDDPTATLYRTIEDARSGFEEVGINAALRSRGWSPGDIRNGASNALDRGADAAILRLTGDQIP